jgi:hypothetical protein
LLDEAAKQNKGYLDLLKEKKRKGEKDYLELLDDSFGATDSQGMSLDDAEEITRIMMDDLRPDPRTKTMQVLRLYGRPNGSPDIASWEASESVGRLCGRLSGLLD